MKWRKFNKPNHQIYCRSLQFHFVKTFLLLWQSNSFRSLKLKLKSNWISFCWLRSKLFRTQPRINLHCARFEENSEAFSLQVLIDSLESFHIYEFRKEFSLSCVEAELMSNLMEHRRRRGKDEIHQLLLILFENSICIKI